jgi:hypothetical protein
LEHSGAIELRNADDVATAGIPDVVLGLEDDVFECNEANYTNELEGLQSSKKRRNVKIGIGILSCCVLVAVIAPVVYLMMVGGGGGDDNDSINPSQGWLRVLNDGPYHSSGQALVTFSLYFSGSTDLALFESSRFHMKCCDGYEVEMLSPQRLVANISHTFDFDNLSGDCGERGSCDFEWSVVSATDSESGTFSAASNLTTYTYSSDTVLVNPGLLNASRLGVDWGCNDTGMWTVEAEPWSSLSVGAIMLSEYNTSGFHELIAAFNYNATTCDVLSRRIENITGQGTGTLWFQTTPATFDDIFSDIELDWTSVLSRAMMIPLESTVNVTGVTSNASFTPLFNPQFFDDDGGDNDESAFELVYPFDVSLTHSQPLDATVPGATMGVTLGVGGGVALGGTYQKTWHGRTGTVWFELKQTQVELRPYFEIENSGGVTASQSLGEYRVLSLVVMVGLVPLTISVEVVPRLFVELEFAGAVQASVTATALMAGKYTVAGSTVDGADLIAVTDSSFQWTSGPLAFELAKAPCSLTGSTGVEPEFKLGIGVWPFSTDVLEGSIATRYGATLAAYSPSKESAQCDCDQGEAFSTDISLGSSGVVDLTATLFGLEIDGAIQVAVSEENLIETCHQGGGEVMEVLCNSCLDPTSAPTSGSPVASPSGVPTAPVPSTAPTALIPSAMPSAVRPTGVPSAMPSSFEWTCAASVVIPHGVTSIPDNAFDGCTELTTVTIPDSVTSIGVRAFAYTSLTSVTIPANVTIIEDVTFYYCTSLTSVIIPDGVLSIGFWSFGYCVSLSSVTFPHSITRIGYAAFHTCNSLVSVTIPDSVTMLSTWAFGYCTSLTSVNIPNSITTIWPTVFYHCSSLTSLTIPDSVTSIGSSACYRCSSLTSLTIPDSVTSIESSAFSYCSSLTSVTIPNGLSSIESSAFNECSLLTAVTIPDSVTSIGSAAFADCTSLSSLIIGVNVSAIGASSFARCSSLTSVTIPNGVTSIGSSAFSHTALTAITIPDSVTSIEQHLFRTCSSLESVTIGASVTSIGIYAFGECSSLTTVNIPNSVTNIADTAFAFCASLPSVIIPDSVTTLGEKVFLYCTSLASVSIGSGVTTLGESLFYNCNSLLSVTIPNSVTTIGDGAFGLCTSLASLTIGNGVATTGYASFYQCESLTSVTILNSATRLGNNSFWRCYSLSCVQWSAPWSAVEASRVFDECDLPGDSWC